MIDLHTHSTFSDGTMTPEQLLGYAEKRKIEVLALTDHDTVDGLDRFMNADSGIVRVPGIELSVGYEPGTFHLAGLFIDYKNKTLLRRLEKLKTARQERNAKLIEKMSVLVGRSLSEKDISVAHEGELGRPHLAKFLIREGYASHMQDAFDKYLGTGSLLHVPKERLDFPAAIELIHEAGGAAILAHPMTLQVDIDKYSPFIKYLKTLGLDGLEVWCSDTPADRYEMFLDIAKEHGLSVSGGSDFHGDNNLSVALGTGRGDMQIPVSVYEELCSKYC